MKSRTFAIDHMESRNRKKKFKKIICFLVLVAEEGLSSRWQKVWAYLYLSSKFYSSINLLPESFDYRS